MTIALVTVSRPGNRICERMRSPFKIAAAARYYRRIRQHLIAEHWESELVKAGRCNRCGRLLVDPKSVAGSIGPECRKQENR
jgi:hypothetical protein